MRDLNPNLTITNHTLLICHVNFAPVPQSKMTYYLYCSLGNFSCPYKHFQGPLRKRHPEGNFVQPHEDRKGREQLPQQIRGRAAAGNPKKLPALMTVLDLMHKTGDCYVYGFITQIRADYNKTIKEADMLENHIIQAKKRADTAEKEAYERIKENTGNARDDQGQFAFLVKSAFSWCVDSSLLKEHNLISPADYLPAEPPHVEPRTAGMLWMLRGAAVRNEIHPSLPKFFFLSVKRDLARHTISSRTHVPQNDGNQQIPGLASDFSLTLESSSDAEKRTKTPKKVVSQRPETDYSLI